MTVLSLFLKRCQSRPTVVSGSSGPTATLPASVRSGGARNDAGTLRHAQLCQHVAQFAAVFALDAARYTAAAGIVGISTI